MTEGVVIFLRLLCCLLVAGVGVAVTLFVWVGMVLTIKLILGIEP